MTRLLAVLIVLLALASPLCAAEKTVPPEVERFLRSRVVLGAVTFTEGSATLDASSRQAIDQILPRLESLDPSASLVRVEGFASAGGGGSVNVPISMDRARAVVDYIRSRQHLAIELFLSGYGGPETTGATESQACRAEIAVYANIWRMNGADIEKVVQR